jgi:hypothetical protein
MRDADEVNGCWRLSKRTMGWIVSPKDKTGVTRSLPLIRRCGLRLRCVTGCGGTGRKQENGGVASGNSEDFCMIGGQTTPCGKPLLP